MATTDKVGAPLLLEGRDWWVDPAFVPALPGTHQVRNANLAWQMLQAQEALPVDRAAFEQGLRRAHWPARFEQLGAGPLTDGVETWIDGAHNGDAARALAAILDDRGPMHLVLGILANKDADEIVAPLRPHALSLTFVPVPDHAHHDPAELARRFGGNAAQNVGEALAGLPAPRLVAGSLYLAGAALAANNQVPD
jgi:dihydrofolate synthase/folylpolyglutamate synthase